MSADGMRWFRWVVLAAVCGWTAVSAQAQLEGQTVKGFRLPEYNADGSLKQQLNGETATFLPDGIIQLTGLTIELFHRGAVAARVTSPECAYAPTRKRAASKSSIRIVTEQGVVTGDGFAWNGENEQFQIFKNAKVTLAANLDREILPAGEVAPISELDGGGAGTEE